MDYLKPHVKKTTPKTETNIPTTPVLWRLRQEDCSVFETSPSYKIQETLNYGLQERPCLKSKQTKKMISFRVFELYFNKVVTSVPLCYLDN